MTDLVSVIVPVYNHARYIEGCLDSIDRQSYPLLELIIIDDGSQDRSFELAQKWCDRYRTRFERVYLERQDNQGICKTLNKLVTLAQGEFIAPLASDDYFLSDSITARVEALQSRPDWLAICGDAILVNPDGNVLSKSAIDSAKLNRAALLNDRLRSHEIVLNWNVPLQILAFRRDAFDREKGVGLYDESLSYEDRDICLRLSAKHAYGFIDLPIYAYRVRVEELSSDIYTTTPGLDSTVMSTEFIEIGWKNSTLFMGMNRLYLAHDRSTPTWWSSSICKSVRLIYKIKFLICKTLKFN
jgi:glycosyltransferase involved in cell wall biosynthesis